MTRHSHHFVDTYDGLVGFGLNRETDENTIIYYLQKFSDDELMRQIVPKMKDAELSEIFELISRLLKRHLSEADYHRLFLKDEDHE
ncbi:MAG TPA: cytoplasmic protein [Desulfobacterales bacterium]